MDFQHVSVLLNETIDLLNINPDGIYVDGTIGGGGHSIEICKRLRSGMLIGIDQDTEALKAASERLKEFKEKVLLVNDNFKNIPDVLKSKEINRVDGILMDIGVSSYQLDEGERGFSYQHNAPLDMRMNKSAELNAHYIINNYPEDKLTKILFEYGEEKWSKRIARLIVQERQKKQINTTYELVEIIKMAIPASGRREGPHPAKRTFQAIRIEVNDELNVLEKAVVQSVDVLNKNGRICVITFHSLEDRIVKEAFAKQSNPCTCPPSFPICACKKIPTLKVVTKKPITASDFELENNPRSRSAKLRVAERV